MMVRCQPCVRKSDTFCTSFPTQPKKSFSINMAKSIQSGKSAAFKIKGYGGKEYTGRGIVQEFIERGGALVELTSDDLGGFGTYRKGDVVRIMDDEFICT